MAEDLLLGESLPFDTELSPLVEILFFFLRVVASSASII
jgi:hypothetical protein